MFQRIKALGRDLAVYGAGDVATQAISFLLLPVYVRFLSPGDYGVLALLLAVEMITKIVFRWGVDASFMRMVLRLPRHDGAAPAGEHHLLFSGGR